MKKNTNVINLKWNCCTLGAGYIDPFFSDASFGCNKDMSALPFSDNILLGSNLLPVDPPFVLIHRHPRQPAKVKMCTVTLVVWTQE